MTLMSDSSAHNRISTRKLISELQRVAELCEGTPTTRDMLEYGEYSTTPYTNRFGSWTCALEEAGISPTESQKNRSERHRQLDKETIIAELQRVFEENGKVTKEVVDEHAEMSSTTVQSYFPGFNSALREANVPITHQVGVSETFECKGCGDEVTRAPWEFEQHEFQFCSYDCLQEPVFDATCDWCGKDTEVRVSHHKREDRTFCSDDCRNAFYKKNPSNAVEAECGYCGEAIVRNGAVVEQSENIYCSSECADQDRVVTKEELVADLQKTADDLGRTPTLKDITTHANHGIDTYYRRFDNYTDAVSEAGLPPNNSSEEVECLNCGNTERRPSSLVRTKTFCDQDCYFEWLRDGAENPHGTPDYDPNWPQQRSATLERDGYECQSCGMSKERHIDQYGTLPHVHHITKWHKFEDPEKRNALENLVTFCASCHTKWEHLPVKPEIG